MARWERRRDDDQVPKLEVTPKEPSHAATAWWREGFFGFTVLDANGRLLFDDDGSCSQQGAEREIRSLGALYAASKTWIDWSEYRNTEVGNELARLDRAHWDIDTRRALDRVFV